MGTFAFDRVAASIFAVAAAIHAYRLVRPFAVQIGAITVPHGASWVMLVVAGALSVWGFRSGRAAARSR